MDVLFKIAGRGPFSAPEQESAVAALESGKVIFLPDCGFVLHPEEHVLLTPAVLGHAKNVSMDPAGKLKHAAVGHQEHHLLHEMMRRFAEDATALVEGLFPEYRGKLERARTSFRPAEIEGRRASPIKDDTRLHVDAFPTTPMRGRRILRVFANINREAPRIWNVGEPFEAVARRFLPKIKSKPASLNALLSLIGVTKARRSAYDDLMLGLHDNAKLDLSYQRDCKRERVAFPAGSMWLCYTDQVMHAALKGQHALEQTFHLPVAAMAEPARTPLRVLEKMTGRKLV